MVNSRPRATFTGFIQQKVRRNHALEHATVNVIEERYGPSNIAGMAYEDGFTLKGTLDPY